MTSPPAGPPASPPLLQSPAALAALLLMPLFFATNLVVGRAAVAAISPWTLIFWRWFLAILILLPFAATALVGRRDLLAKNWRALLVLGFIVTVLCGGNVYVSLQFTSATNATLIYTTSTIMIVVLDALLARRPLPPAHIVGAVAGFAGIALIAVQGELGRLLNLSFNIGDLGILVAAIAWAAYSLMIRKSPLNALGPVPAFTAVALVGTLLLVPPMLWEAAHQGHLPAGAMAWTSVLILAIFPSVLAFILFQYCVRVVGAPVTAIFLYIMPVYGVVMALILLGEQLHLYHAVGFALVLGGVILATRPVNQPNGGPAR
ncbi:DMT family transporter [Bosea sp. 117]|uniref:DMT family transporter n=1 Tax=Bosea sp. 117 TaxID=1125973 RepID=UPI0018CC6650|nr:DMT family transporter [Bosea sp. 117]